MDRGGRIKHNTMAAWFEVFDNDVVLERTRKEINGLYASLAVAVILPITLLPLFLTNQEVLWALFVGGFAIFGVYELLQLIAERRQIVWCIKLSDHQIIGYDYARTKRVMDWTQMDHIELTDVSLIVRPQTGPAFEIPHLYPDFATLSHRIIEYADLYHIPICINGAPWEDIDLRSIYPD